MRLLFLIRLPSESALGVVKGPSRRVSQHMRFRAACSLHATQYRVLSVCVFWQDLWQWTLDACQFLAVLLMCYAIYLAVEVRELAKDREGLMNADIALIDKITALCSTVYNTFMMRVKGVISVGINTQRVG